MFPIKSLYCNTQKRYLYITIFILIILIIFIKLEEAKFHNAELIDEGTVISSSKIAVVVVIEKESQLESYMLTQSTVACYCKIYGYKLIKVIIDRSREMQTLCPQKHIWFKRLCVHLRILQLHPEIQYSFFLDADIAVINPNHRLEDYLDSTHDLFFYDRVFNYDIMVGSYILKNTKYAIKFVQDWLKLESFFETNYGANDNAAIKQVLLNWFYPNHPRKVKCEKIWTDSDRITLDGHNQYVACTRSIMNDRLEFDKIIIYPKGSHKAWARDVWLTNSEWAPRDFMFHDMEDYKITSNQEHIDRDPRYFPNPFVSDAVFHSSLCEMPNGLNCWKYNTTFFKDDEYIDKRIQKVTDKVRKKYLEFIKTL